MTLSKKILLGLLAGVVVGLFLGDKAAAPEFPARAFVQLLQATVLPFVVGSLIAGVEEHSGPSPTPGHPRRRGPRVLCLP